MNVVHLCSKATISSVIGQVTTYVLRNALFSVSNQMGEFKEKFMFFYYSSAVCLKIDDSEFKVNLNLDHAICIILLLKYIIYKVIIS